MKKNIKRLFGKWKNSFEKRRTILRQYLDTRPKPNTCIIVASNGRSGSTLTFQTIRQGMLERDVRTAGKFQFVSRLSEVTFPRPFVYKTHDFPDALSEKRDGVRVVFCFGSTKDSALSVYSAVERYGEDWVEKHFYNLHADGTFEDLLKKDVLQQARQIREWATFEDVPVLCVHYDAIWDHKAEISEFISLDFEPPKRRKREPKKIPENLLTAASAVYDPIDEIVAELPRIFLASKQYSDIVAKLPE